jgi:curved DNA-binding protein CbpA
MLAAMPAFVDHYEVLGVAPGASAGEVRQAYRRLVAQEHADRHGGDPRAVERTRRLNLARDVLVDPARRAGFDRERDLRLVPPRDPLFDTLARTFGATPPPGPAPAKAPPVTPAPTWLKAVLLGVVGAAGLVTIGAAAAASTRKRAARTVR